MNPVINPSSACHFMKIGMNTAYYKNIVDTLFILSRRVSLWTVGEITMV